MSSDHNDKQDNEQTVLMNSIPDELAAAIAQTNRRSSTTSTAHSAALPHTLLSLEHMLQPISKTQVAWNNRLVAMLPNTQAEQGFVSTVCEFLEEVTGMQHHVHLHEMIIHEQTPSSGFTFANNFVTELTLPPCPEPAVLCVDTSLVAPWLATMLGDVEFGSRRLGPINTRTFAMMTYLILRLIDRNVARHGAPPLIVAGTIPEQDTLQRTLRQARDLVELVYLVTGDTIAGFVRIFLPQSVVQAFEKFETQRAKRQPSLQGVVSRLECDVDVCLGYGKLTPLENADLRTGDVVFLREHGLAQHETSKQGGSWLAIHGKCCPITLNHDPNLSRWRLQVEGPFVAPALLRRTLQTKDETHDALQEDVMMENTPMLVEDATVRVDVRMGKTTMTVAELGALGVGQILTLDTTVGVMVELVVGDEVLGQGELVDVEGHLGVRIVSLSS